MMNIYEIIMLLVVIVVDVGKSLLSYIVVD